ncbi:hypothetical protein [Proteiniborus sp. MB09-C3]|uniref:hypothetical protein n=1 Tax=Proteiniborus sp. MB09-C3 TaxID=3050072 RepID=UPI002555386F|nr:hypothetical protein [Proteiniborus sp. MB09-C3]WIV11150.1 hypothetical protein QO263_13455 [Proteiniborus sp. MB09-C3]
MKIEMAVKIIKTGMEFTEEYDIDNSLDPVKYAQNLIDRFNDSLRPNERPRELINVTVKDINSPTKTLHMWEKQNLVTQMRGGLNYDNVKCIKCGITAKRIGLTAIKRDSKYKAKIYDTCEGAIAQLEKLEKRRKNG